MSEGFQMSDAYILHKKGYCQQIREYNQSQGRLVNIHIVNILGKK